MLDDVKSWNGKKGFVTKSHIQLREHTDVKSNEQCQGVSPWRDIIIRQRVSPCPVLFIIYLSRVLCLCVCVCITIKEHSCYSFCFNNQTDQENEMEEGLEREGLKMER
jgi:hypothetical protein